MSQPERTGVSSVLGIDAGGTHTRVALADLDGRVLVRCTGPGSNPVRVGVDRASAHLAQTLRDVLTADGARGARLQAVVVGLAGVSHPESRRVLTEAFVGWPAPPIRLLSDDVSLAFDTAFGRRDGVLVLSGTGSGASARRGEIRRRIGGFGPVIGDEGSGPSIVLDACREVLRAAQGRAQPTTLTERFTDALGLDRPERLPFAVSASADFAQRLFPLVVAGAAEGDPTATNVLLRAAIALGGLALEVAELTGLERVGVATAGGALGASEALQDGVFAFLDGKAPGRFVRCDHVDDGVPAAIERARMAVIEGCTTTDW